MSEEILFDCLHAEIVNYCLDSNKVGTRGTLKKSVIQPILIWFRLLGARPGHFGVYRLHHRLPPD